MNLNVLSKVGSALVTKMPKQALWISTHKSEIFTGIGIAAGAASTVTACRASFKMREVLDERDTNLSEIAEASDYSQTSGGGKYSEEDAKKDTMLAHVNMIKSTAKLYAPAAILGLVSVGCIIGGHNVLRKENAALAAALTGLTEAFKGYRDRVKKELGADKERELYFGKDKIEVTTDENGNVVSESVVDPCQVSPYMRWFDSDNVYWENNAKMNLMWLRCQQNYANDKLQANGYLFLNDVYEMLGLKPSEAGQYVGWVYEHGDGFVDFGFTNEPGRYARDFINGVGQIDETTGEMKPVRLDFNVDGVIAHIFNKAEFNHKMANTKA